jgi:5-methylthioadenosine/S-adenosylhomocysteine deaminase
MKRQLIVHGLVIPVDGNGSYIEDGAVAIEGDRIAAVGPTTEIREGFDAEETINARGKAVLPGFVNTHIHLNGAINKALTEDLSGISGGLFKVAMPLHYKYLQRSDVYWLALMHALEVLKTGTTTVNEIGRFESEVAKVVRDSGLRAVMAENIRETDVMQVRPGNLQRDFIAEEAESCIEMSLAFIKEWQGAADGRITCRFGPNAPDNCSEQTLLKVKELAEKHQIGLHTHLAQVPGEAEYVNKAYGKSPVKFLHDIGYLSPNLVAAHCVFMSPEDVMIMRDTGAHMSHTAYLVGKRAYFPPMTEVYRQGMSVSLGSDWLSNDMFKMMRAAILLARQQCGSIEILDGPSVLKMATLGGAGALGMEKEIGSLEPGKKADIFLLNLRTPWLNPIRPQQIISNIVYNANGSDVTHVMVDGRLVVADGVFALIDEEVAYRECQNAAGAVWERARDIFEG